MVKRDDLAPWICTLLFVLCIGGAVFAYHAYARAARATSCGNAANNFCNVKYIRTYDGDTFYINIDRVPPIFGAEIGVRVKSIDTPEIRGASEYEKSKGRLARDYTEQALSGAKRIDLTNCDRGKYFRIACDVLYDGNDLGIELILNGLAIGYKE